MVPRGSCAPVCVQFVFRIGIAIIQELTWTSKDF